MKGLMILLSMCFSHTRS